jgi:hypothetical protein
MYIRRTEDGNLILYKKDENNVLVEINNGSIVKYTGILYKKIKNSQEHFKIETEFIGRIEEYKSNHENGYEGIFIAPLFIYNSFFNQWKRIINYSPPKYGNKYFFYPHLLMLPDFHSNHYPLYYLETCENVNLKDYEDINETFEL